MRVSVTIAAYNLENYIARCIESAQAQTAEDMEIIIVDDGSTDKTGEIIRAYAEKDARIRAFYTENRGVSKARNRCLAEAKGDYIAFIDGDDYMHPDMMRRLYEAAVATDSDIAVCNEVVAFDDRVEDKKLLRLPAVPVVDVQANDAQFIADVFDEKEQIGGAVHTKLFRRAFLENAGVLFEERSAVYAEDAFFAFCLLKHANRLCVVDDGLYYYYRRSDSVSNTYKPDFARRCLQFITRLQSYYGDSPKIAESLHTRTFTFFLEILQNEVASPGGYKTYKETIGGAELRALLKRANVRHYTPKRKCIYLLYRLRLYYILYCMYRKRGGTVV